MTRDIILAIDNGTQSVRALLFDLRGNLLAKSRVFQRSRAHLSPAGQSRTPRSTGPSCARHASSSGSRPTSRGRRSPG